MGAIHFGYKLAFQLCLTADPCGAPVIPNNSKVFVGADLSGWKRGFAGGRAQPPGFNADPKFSLANSPLSPVDRLRLLTAPSNVAARDAVDRKAIDSPLAMTLQSHATPEVIEKPGFVSPASGDFDPFAHWAAILDKVRRLPPAKQEEVLRFADGLQDSARARIVPSRDRTVEMKWIDLNRAAYADQWVAVEGDRLVAAGNDPLKVFAAAKEEGIRIPFVVHMLPEDPLPFVPGW